MEKAGRRESVLEFLKKKEASNRNLIFASDDRDSLIKAFDPSWSRASPYTVLIDPECTIVFREEGSFDPSKSAEPCKRR